MLLVENKSNAAGDDGKHCNQSAGIRADTQLIPAGAECMSSGVDGTASLHRYMVSGCRVECVTIESLHDD